MSNPLDPRLLQSIPPEPPRGEKRPAIFSILMFVFGLILLLPGVCAIIFASGSLLYAGRATS